MRWSVPIPQQDPDRFAERARERPVAGLRGIHGPMRGIEDVPVCGAPDDVVRGLREVIDAGAGTVLLDPPGGSLDGDREQVELLAADVLPRVGEP